MGTEEAAHVLHKAEHVRFDDLEEIKRFADVRQRNLLRGGDDDALGVGDGVKDGHMLVTGPGRGIDEQIVQRAPLHVGDELLNGSNLFGAAPDDGGVLVFEEGFDGDEREAFAAGNGHELAVFVIHPDEPVGAEQVRDARAMQIHVEDADVEALRRQRGGEVHGH